MLHTARPNTSSSADGRALICIHREDSIDEIALQLPANVEEQFDTELASRILTRIETRLPCRVRDLAVLTAEDTVVLTGQCNTFYTKQMAQHVAMGALEYERLVNRIEVHVTK